MVTIIIFYLHFIFALSVFTWKWQQESLSAALINLSLIGILFAVGWSVTGIIANLLMEQKGFGLFFDRDAFSLTLLTIAEFFFYKFYYNETPTEAGKEKQ
ncbi:MAG: hypothetical protein Kow0098_17370 [Ignavibacteriaceae bacterium]